MEYGELSRRELEALRDGLRKEYEEAKGRELSLDMSRGNPGPEQLRMGQDLLDACPDVDGLFSADGVDCRNYGCPGGLRELRELFGGIIGVPASNVYVGGVSSLNMMFDTVSRAMLKGLAGSPEPWGKLDEVKFICPVPGYDRHLSILEFFGIEMIPVPLTGEGPDMDEVERIAASDPAVKGMWIVPIYSNPSGDIYSRDTLHRIASMETAAPDFTVFCDDAYPLHALYGEFEPPLTLYDECVRAGHPDRAILFSSFSKVTFAGGSVCCVAGGDRTMELARKWFSVQVITHDKVNQLRHVRVLKDVDGVKERMNRHAAIIRPRFELVEEIFERELGGTGTASWNRPRGGYFIALRLNCSARRVVSLCADAGVKLTPAGAGFPHGVDPSDGFLRIAPTYPSMEDLEKAAELLCVCVRLAACEKLLSE